jgi:uncharacterized membrane protein HdeD (DUF308 family)
MSAAVGVRPTRQLEENKMATLNPLRSAMQHAISEALSTHWRLLLFQGVIMLLLGILAFLAPVAATIAADIFIGWLFLISGVVGLVAVFSAKDIPAFLWSLITAALSVTAGVLLIWKPVEGALTLTLLLTALFITEGIFQIAASIAYRHVPGGSAGWMLVSGLADLALVAVIIAGWPVTAVWTLGILVAVNLITSGWAIVMAAFAGRSLAHAAGGAPATAAGH